MPIRIQKKPPHPVAYGARPLPRGERAHRASCQAVPLIRTRQPSPLAGEGAAKRRVRGLFTAQLWRFHGERS